MLAKRLFMFASALFVVMFIAACGSSTTTGSGTTPTLTTPPATPTTAPTSTVQTATATVKGKSETILTNVQGKTLYYFTPDTSTTSACTSACAQAWPPLISSSSGSPLADAPLSGKLSVVSDANGSQIEYNGHLLYAFSGDTAPGQTNGQGLFGKWFVCTPGLAAA
jgi:predicted lipoprotein with Yx(FWY)xxD motif